MISILCKLSIMCRKDLNMHCESCLPCSASIQYVILQSAEYICHCQIYMQFNGTRLKLMFILAPSTINGVSQIVYDNITEFPSTINVLKRFNLYPELIIGIGYRLFESFTNAAKIKTQTCWKVSIVIKFCNCAIHLISVNCECNE